MVRPPAHVNLPIVCRAYVEQHVNGGLHILGVIHPCIRKREWEVKFEASDPAVVLKRKKDDLSDKKKRKPKKQYSRRG